MITDEISQDIQLDYKNNKIKVVNGAQIYLLTYNILLPYKICGTDDVSHEILE